MAFVNEAVLRIPWEPLQPGPVGEYVAVVDRDEFAPVNLDDPYVLARDGLTPSDGNLKFHQQMVYAVAMRTIGIFEKALGRRVQWAPINGKFTKRIVIHPHHSNDPNAQFLPPNELNFGYFEASPESLYPGMIVFTCLSQDVIAHLVSHAVLWGMPFELESDQENLDTMAFQEGFVDLVALLQRFSQPELLRHQLALTCGDLAGPSQLGIIASQFGEAMGKRSGIRSAFGEFDEEGNWHPRRPNPKDYQTMKEAHERGSLLVSAVFDALNRIYSSRIVDLKRIATEGAGILPKGELHPDLVNRLALEASKSADHVLNMCIRALDYCPSFGITFGDYLRAIITADFDLVPVDPRNYRVAFVEAFRSYGILPANIGTLSVETLLWPKLDPDSTDARVIRDFIQQLASEYSAWNLPNREELFIWTQGKARELKEYLSALKDPKILDGIDHRKPFRVHSIWPHECVSPTGGSLSQWVIRVIQSLSPGQRLACCTLIVDTDTGDVRYAISKVIGEPIQEEKPRNLLSRFSEVMVPPPVERRLRVFAFDPSSATQMETARINQVTLHVPWEKEKLYVFNWEEIPGKDNGRLLEFLTDKFCSGWIKNAKLDKIDSGKTIRVYTEKNSLSLKLNDDKTEVISEIDDGRTDKLIAKMEGEKLNIYEKLLRPGPVGEYLEVVDYDPATGCFYDPVDLNDKHLIAEDGLTPSQSNPQFHQQMVYAVAMRTIRNFEHALGRLALWSPHRDQREHYVQRLRLYPHALREANAFYSPDKKAVLFGYFQTAISSTATPVTVFTCLSHDIIVHELTHALLDGMHRRFAEPSNPDVLAFHEAFADLVALFQHFSLPEVLENQIAATRGDLASQNRLGELAQEFGRAIGNRGALRSAIGEYDKMTGEWRPKPPNPEAYIREMEPHARGSLLVAAVFDAFLTLYRSRTADLFRIATKGSGVLPAGQLHPDLVRRLAAEAADCAQDILEMCIRALDYCPPVDMTFGDYLRAVVTADYEFDPVDEDNRRIAFIEAFRRHGILPEDVRTFSLEGLLWPVEDEKVVMYFIKNWTDEIKSWNLSHNRYKLSKMMSKKRKKLHAELKNFLDDPAIKKRLSFIDPDYKFEVHSLRPSARTDLHGKSHLQWIIEITQWVPDFLDPEDAEKRDAEIARATDKESERLREYDYRFRGGATLLVDAETGQVRYSIRKHLRDLRRRERQRQYMSDIAIRSLCATYFRGVHNEEPFAALHRF